MKQYKCFATRVYAAMFNQGWMEYTVENGCGEFYAVPIGNEKIDYIVPHPGFDEACHRIGENFMAESESQITNYKKRKAAIIDYAHRLSDAAGRVTDDELKELFIEYWKIYREFQPYNMFPHYMERELEPVLAKKFPENFGLISSISRPTEHMRMHRALFKNGIEEVVKEFDWLSIYAMTEAPFDAAYFENYKLNLKEQEVEKVFEEMERNNDSFEEFISGLDPSDRKLCEVAREFVFMRTDRVDAMEKHVFLLYPFAKYLASKVSPALGVREGSMLLREEIIDILEGKFPVTEEELILRGKRNELIEAVTSTGALFIKNEDLKNKLLEASKQFLNSNTISGVGACKGKVKGGVKVYLSSADIGAADRDFIMVCKHTSPQDLPYMKKARAIVTDEGGITCHAAIVSRELNIPCIVGTKNATSKLKNGDEVEVDAEKGVVKILKRSDET